jgi:hypothetical protein
LKIWFTNLPVGCRNEKHLSRLEESAMRRGGWPLAEVNVFCCKV